jgi:hypothetical protein
MEPLEILQLVVSNLEKLNVDYMVGGSFASSIYGLARFTQDVDLIANLRPDQVDGFMRIFGREFYLDGGSIERALGTGTSFNIIHFESSFKVDFFILSKSKFKEEQFSRRLLRRVNPDSDFEAYVQSPEDIILSKLEWYRRGGEASENQWRDVIGIIKTQGGRLDLVYLRKWAVELGVSDLLEQASKEAGKV